MILRAPHIGLRCTAWCGPRENPASRIRAPIGDALPRDHSRQLGTRIAAGVARRSACKVGEPAQGSLEHHRSFGAVAGWPVDTGVDSLEDCAGGDEVLGHQGGDELAVFRPAREGFGGAQVNRVQAQSGPSVQLGCAVLDGEVHQPVSQFVGSTTTSLWMPSM